MVSLRPIDSSNYRECIELSVAPHQQRFVASNLQSLADAYVWREAASRSRTAETTTQYPSPERNAGTSSSA